MRRLLLVLALLTPLQALALPKSITLAADTWCPYNCEPESDMPGYVIEIAKAIYEPQGIMVHYEVAPWTRAINDTRHHKFDAIIGATKSKAPDFMYPKELIGISVFTFFTVPGSTWHYENIASLKGILLGTVDGYSYDNHVDTYIESNHKDRTRVQVVGGNLATNLNIKKLLAGRIDAVLEDPNVIDKSLHDLGKEANSLRIAGSLDRNEDSELYLAFSPSNPDSKALAQMFDLGIAQLRRDGKLDGILHRYGVKDWK